MTRAYWHKVIDLIDLDEAEEHLPIESNIFN